TCSPATRPTTLRPTRHDRHRRPHRRRDRRAPEKRQDVRTLRARDRHVPVARRRDPALRSRSIRRDRGRPAGGFRPRGPRGVADRRPDGAADQGCRRRRVARDERPLRGRPRRARCRARGGRSGRMTADIRNLADRLRHVAERRPELLDPERTGDTEAALAVWRPFYPQAVTLGSDEFGVPTVTLRVHDLLSVPSVADVARERRKLVRAAPRTGAEPAPWYARCP